jgi:hypothetical protein
MRAAPLLIAALALAACHVNVEGAPCALPGATTDCPGGQACGNDGRCSTRAAGCVSAQVFCTPGVTAKRCSANFAAIETCFSGDEVCGSWGVATAQDDCAAAALVCGEPAGAAACVCSTPTSELAVDVGAPQGPHAPTGAAQPTECRFSKLGDALAAASARGGATTVKAYASAGTPVVFASEAFPLVVPPGVTLATDATPSKPSDWIVTAASGTGNVVELHEGAVVDGFTFRSTGATGDGMVVTCAAGATSPAIARNVVVDGGNALGRGVVVTGTCGLVVTQLDESRATKAGLYVDASSPSVGISITGGSLRNNGQSGAEVIAGLLSLAGTGATARFDISANGRHGVRAASDPISPRALSLALSFVDVHNNGEVGVLVRDLAAASSGSISSSFFRKNSATAAYSIYGTGRIAGGLLLWGNLPMTQGATPVPAFAFKGNTVCSNTGDAIGVYSNDPWPLSGDACNGTSNVFVNPAASSYYVYSTTAGADLPAVNNLWAPDPPTGLVMKAAFVPSCGPATVPVECN